MKPSEGITVDQKSVLSSSCQLVFDAAAASNHHQSVVWIEPSTLSTASVITSSSEETPDSALLIYSSHAMLHIATRSMFLSEKQPQHQTQHHSKDREETIETRNTAAATATVTAAAAGKEYVALWKRQSSLRTDALLESHECITCVAEVRPPRRNKHENHPLRIGKDPPALAPPPTALAVGFSSGRVIVWILEQSDPKDDKTEAKARSTMDRNNNNNNSSLENDRDTRTTREETRRVQNWKEYPVRLPLSHFSTTGRWEGAGGSDSVNVIDAMWIEPEILCLSHTCTSSHATAPPNLEEERQYHWTLAIMSGSCGGAIVYTCRHFHTHGLRIMTQTVLFESTVASVSLQCHQDDLLCLLGTAAPRNNQIRVYQCTLQQVTSTNTTEKITTKANATADPLNRLSFQDTGALTGHQDWITCMDFWSNNIYKGMSGTATPTYTSTAAASERDSPLLVLASGSNDCKIRLWNFHVVTIRRHPSKMNSTVGILPHEDSSQNPFTEDDDEEEHGESRINLFHQTPRAKRNDQDKTAIPSMSCVTLEAILVGHEAAVTSVQWHPNPAPIYGRDQILLSSSMDRTILLWAFHPTDTTEDYNRNVNKNDEIGVWAPLPRLGIAGGILGGPIGSSLLGFCRAVWEPRYGRSIVGHAYGGALHVWSIMDDSGISIQKGMNVQLNTFDANSIDYERNKKKTDERDHVVAASMKDLVFWKANPGLTGHFQEVTDLCWEAMHGAYFVTVSRDQTCRLWAKVSLHDVWIELARPQVHGYELTAIASLSTPHTPHRIVTAADEKELRVFDAPWTTLRTLEHRCGVPLSSALLPTSISPEDIVSRVERAYIPSLGLTNKSSPGDGIDVANGENDEDVDIHNVLRTSLATNARIPLERDLGVTSIWPESNKLFGHSSELFCVTTTADFSSSSQNTCDKVLIASSTKARDAANASIRIWDAGSGKCLQILTSHKATVATMSFSSNGRFLVSSGKDRQISLWEKKGTKFSLTWSKDSAHKRIVWSVHFNPLDDHVFASGSRDGSVKVWKIYSSSRCEVELLHSFYPRVSETGIVTAVTALAFAPRIHLNLGYLALGLESGLIQVWEIPRSSEEHPKEAVDIPRQLCHISTVTKLAWRPCDHENPSLLYLASSSSDHGCRVYSLAL